MLALIVAGASATADDETVSGDLKKMQGTWVRAGEDGPDLRWVFEGQTLKASVNGQDYTCTVTLDEKATPNKTVDIAIKDGPGDTSGKTSKAIYKFDGDRLCICVTHPGGDARPREFKHIEDEAFLFEMKKEK
jgi:uncharacterized protein (TIGR03067 family)